MWVADPRSKAAPRAGPQAEKEGGGHEDVDFYRCLRAMRGLGSELDSSSCYTRSVNHQVHS